MKKRKANSKRKDKKFIKGLVLRYLLMIAVAIPGLWLFYFIFTPLTAYPVYWLLSLFFDAILAGNIIILNKTIPIELIRACIAGAAYYLLFVLNMSIPNIKPARRIKMIATAFGTLLILNILRIFSLTFVYVSGYSFFDVAHKVFWYGISTVFVVGIWFGETWLFKIKEIPFYSDIKLLYNKYIRHK